MLVEVAEARALPASEGVEGQRHRNRHVHPNHANGDAGGEVARRVTIAGEDRNAIAIFMLRGQAQRLLVGAGPHHREDRAEDLLAIDAHLGAHMVEQAAAHVEAVLIALHDEVAPVHLELGALVDADGHIVAHPLQRLAGDQWPEIGIRIGGRADLETLDARHQTLHQRLRRHLAHGHGDRDRHAALAGRTVSRPDERIGGPIHVRVRHDDHVVLGAAEALHPLAIGRAASVDVGRDGGGADKTDGGDVRIVEQRVHGHLVADHHVENARRQARLDHELGEPEGHRGVALGRLEHEGIAAGDGRRELPHRDHGRKVEGRDAGHHAEGLAHGVHVDAGADPLAELALEQVRNATGELDHLEPPLQIALGVGNGLAMLARKRQGKLVIGLAGKLEETEEHTGARLRASRRPSGLGRLGILDGLAHLLGRGIGRLCRHLARHRPVDVPRPSRAPRHPLTADIVIEFLDHLASLASTHARLFRHVWNGG